MKGRIGKTLKIGLAAIFAVSLMVGVIRIVQQRQIEKVNNEALALATQSMEAEKEEPAEVEPQEPVEEPAVSEQLPEESAAPSQEEPEAAEEQDTFEEEPVEEYVDPYAEELANMDFRALREVNGDILGWIMIPDTKISFPLLQTTDNEYYLDHNWRKGYSSGGAIFLECQNAPDLSDFNTIIYGHRMVSGTMFAELARYEDSSYMEKHPTFYITDDNGIYAYDVFAAYEVSKTGTTYRLELNTDEDRQQFIDYCLQQSAYETGIVPSVDDKIVTLSTCMAYGTENRWVVQGVLRAD